VGPSRAPRGRLGGGAPRALGPPRARDRALAAAGLLALAVLCLAYFPLRLALTGYPATVLVAWIFRGGGEE
jgi:hypothetical protein